MKGEGLKSSSDAQFEIEGFDRERQEEFARRFLKDDQNVEEFFEYLEQQDLEDVAKIPILLLMLLLVWKEKHREGLPSSRPMIYFQFIQALFDHMSEKQEKPAEKFDDHKQELCKLGELAFDALLQDLLYFPLSKLPDHVLTEKLIEAGLFQLLNTSTLNPCKDVHFIHKSMQEFVASLFLKELLSQESKNNCLFKVDSIEKIFKLNEVFKFVAEMSEEAAREILIHLLEMAAKEDGEYRFDKETPSVEDLSHEQKNLITLCTQLFFCCSADTRTELFPTFLSNLGGVFFILNPDQLNIAAKENFVKTTALLMFIFFSKSGQYTEQSYDNLITLAQQLNAVIVSRTGEQKASEFLNVFPWRRVHEFFLMKEENNTQLYFTQIVKQTSKNIPLPFKMVKTLVSLEETTKKTNMNGGGSIEESSSSCCSKRHGLSRVRRIEALEVNRSEVELMIEMMPFITAPHKVWVEGEYGEVYDAELTESLLRSIPITHKLESLALYRINVTSSPAVEFINRVFQQYLVHLEWLDMSYNPLLGAGVDSLIKHLSCAPHLETLYLWGVKMTPQQVMDLTTAVKQHGNITGLWSPYHDLKGNTEPERYWPSEIIWKWDYPHLFPDSSPKSAHEQEQNEGEVIESEDGTPSYESEDNQEQEMENQSQVLSHLEHLSTVEDEKGNLELEDVRSSVGPDDPKKQDVPGGYACTWLQEPGGKEAPGRPQTSYDDDDEGDDQNDSSEDDDDDKDALEGAYDPTDYEHLHVSQEIKDLFQYITRYTPQTIDLEHKLTPFNPDFIPAVGDIDAFLKVTRPDGKPETLGLVVLDEPIAKQSDPTVLDMTIRTISKQTNVKAMTVRSIEDPEKNPKAVDNWIDSIRELHRQKPAPAVHYQRNMPDIEFLMQEWPEEFEELLNKVGLPTADLDVDLKQYVDLVCGILGIPVHNNRIHALHVLFTLFSEFKNSQHFKQLAKDNQLSSDLRLDSGSGNPYTGGVAAATEHMTLSGEEAQTMSFDD